MSQAQLGKQAFETELRSFVGVEIGPPDVAEDVVNEAMIRHWCQAMGDRNPAYFDPNAAKSSVHGSVVAPPTMLQAWAMPGIVVAYDLESLDDRQRDLHALLGEHGYTGVVATDCEQGYDRYLVPGDRVTARTTIESISEEKATALGIGYFIVTRTAFTDQHDAPVGWMTFRVLKFKPAQQPAVQADTGDAPAAPTRLRPVKGHDNAWWWDAIDRGHLLIQKCEDCGALRHPPRPMCPECQSLRWEGAPSTGEGVVHSYTVLHHPPIPGYDFPLAVAVIDLSEGTRIVSNVIDCDPNEVHIGMRVQATIEKVDDALSLPLFRPVR